MNNRDEVSVTNFLYIHKKSRSLYPFYNRQTSKVLVAESAGTLELAKVSP